MRKGLEKLHFIQLPTFGIRAKYSLKYNSDTFAFPYLVEINMASSIKVKPDVLTFKLLLEFNAHHFKEIDRNRLCIKDAKYRCSKLIDWLNVYGIDSRKCHSLFAEINATSVFESDLFFRRVKRALPTKQSLTFDDACEVKSDADSIDTMAKIYEYEHTFHDFHDACNVCVIYLFYFPI